MRLASLDAFRGYTIAAMLLVNNPGDWGHLYAPLAHARWHGWTYTDTIFPFFLFIVGVAMMLSLGRRSEQGAGRGALLRGLWLRAGVIFAIGLLLNFIPRFDLAGVRIPGVLQRIALCTALAAPLVVYGRWRTQAVAIVLLLAVYAAIMLGVPAPDAQGVWHTGSLAPGEDPGAWLDRQVFGAHLWAQARTWDPEGLLSTLPACASLLSGVLAGRLIAAPLAPHARAAWLAVAGALCLFAGTMMDLAFMPINKSLWTPSYAVFMSGWALLVFAIFYRLLDAAGEPLRARLRALATPLTIYGMNALFIFALSGLVAKLLGFIRIAPEGAAPVALKTALFAPFMTLPLSPEARSLAFALCFNAAMFAVAWAMWRKHWFVKV